jgi:RecB family exonuclease
MARLLHVRGARAAEELLLQHIEALVESGRRHLKMLARPVRVMVPSWSLRNHLSATLVQRSGRSIIGVSVQTLHRIALEILERAGKAPPVGDLLFEIVVRRYARQQPELRDELDHLVDGYASVVGTVRDFIDAGFHAAHAEALRERLTVSDTKDNIESEVRRARAIIRVAAATQRTMAELGIGGTAILLERARERLERDPEKVLPARAVLIHGFADATGIATDFIEALMRYRDAWVYLDRPPDPAAPQQLDQGIAFTQRFANRLEQIVQAEPITLSGVPESRLRMLKAPGIHAEIRAVAYRVIELLNQGILPERIAVVARTLRPYSVPIRIHFQRLGIPFSGMGALGPKDSLGRRAGALLEVLSRRMTVPTERWLEALSIPTKGFCPYPEASLADLRLAFHALGASRISDVVKLNVATACNAEGDFLLPSRQGIIHSGDHLEDDGRPRAHRRRLPGAVLEQAVEAAASLCKQWEHWPEKNDFRSHLERLRELLEKDLGWQWDQPEVRDLHHAVDELSHDIDADFEFSYDEFVLLLNKALSGIGASLLGGDGGGVQVLDVIEARGRTFEHLFILGLNRDVFPRVVREDPLFPDYIRQSLVSLLPDMPIKKHGFDEERFLFAELISSSPYVTISWQTIDEQGRVRPASPLVERLRLAKKTACESAPTLYARSTVKAPSGVVASRPAHEFAVLAGLYIGRRDLARILPIAFSQTETGYTHLAISSPELAQARIAVLNEFDPDRYTPEGRSSSNSLGPYYGFIGPLQERADPRLADLFITRVENMAACPWQVFLKQLLHVEPMPDPMEALPSVDPPMLGTLVHAVLERIVLETRAQEKPAKAPRGGMDPVPAPWPDSSRFTQILEEEADRLIREQGIGFSGLARVLVQQAIPHLHNARKMDWPESGSVVHAVGAELSSELEVKDDEGQTRSIRFKADRADMENGHLRLTDYKTGKPISTGMSEKARRSHFLKAVSRGEWLQAVAYVIGTGMEAFEGRYLFLKPEIPDHARIFTLTSRDLEFVDAFKSVTKRVMRAIDQGCFFPRLVEPSGRAEPPRCTYCTVAQPCLRGDSDARARLLRWSHLKNKAMKEDEDLAPWETAFLDVWRLWE